MAAAGNRPDAGFFKDEKVVSGPMELAVSVRRAASAAEVRIALERVSPPVQGSGEQLMLHWGIVPGLGDDRAAYVRPAEALWPPQAETDPRPGEPSVQSYFSKDAASAPARLEFCFSEKDAPAGLVFLVVLKEENPFRGQWIKGPGGSSFYIDVDEAISAGEKERRLSAVAEERKLAEVRARKEKEDEQRRASERENLIREQEARRGARGTDAENYIKEACKGGELFARVDNSYDFGDVIMCAIHPAGTAAKAKEVSEDVAQEDPVPAKLVVLSTIALGDCKIVFHWGVKQGAGSSGWSAPPESCWPPNSKGMGDGKALQTTLALEGKNGLRVAVMDSLPRGVFGFFAVVHIPGAPDHLQWIKSSKNGSDMFIPLTPKPPLKGLPPNYPITSDAVTTIENIIEREMEYGSWTLMHRYTYGNHLVESDVGSDLYAWSAIYVWMRYSQIRVLDWSRNFNTKPRELSHAQLSFVTCLAHRFKNMPEIRWLARLVMSCVGRGGSGDLGQRIRDDILVILRHNRGWGHGSMMEQWHQKLHNATDPCDVNICDALLAFWESHGDIGRYWHVLHCGGVTRERLASYHQAVTSEPDYLPHLRGTMLHELGVYGALLKAVHLGTDLHSIVDRCQGMLDGGTRDQVNGFMHARYHGSMLDVLRSVAHARESLSQQIIIGGNDDHSRRDLIFLDIALESEARRSVESTQGAGHDGTLWSYLVAVRAAARSLKTSETGLKTEGMLDRAIHDVQAVVDRLERQGESHDVGLRAAAGLTLLRNVVTEIVDRYENNLGPIARCMGTAFGGDKQVISSFIEESVRGGPAFVLSSLMRAAEPAVRRVAHLGPYSVISPHEKESIGPVVVFHKLRESIGATFRSGTVVIADICDGDEDVPAKTEFVVIGQSVDVLSHVSVRARNEKHGLIACLDGEELARLRTMHGCIVKAKLVGDDFQIQVVDERGRMSPSSGVKAVMRRVRSKSGIVTPPSGMQTPPVDVLAGQIIRHKSKNDSGAGEVTKATYGVLSPGGMALARKMSSGSMNSEEGREQTAVSQRQLAAPWAVQPSQFNTELVGSKSLNLQRLRALGMAEWVHTPTSFAIPNGAMRKVMQADENEHLNTEYKALMVEIEKARPGDVKACAKLREVVNALAAPEGLNEALRGVLFELGCEDIDAALPGAWVAVKGVWASIWNERAHLARLKLGLRALDVDMAVLCQKVVDADYAFVIHTTNPLTNDKNEIYAECVVGLGETLVGNAPGQALGFTVRKDEDLDTATPIIRSYPSKGTALVGGEFIFRSDSNAEDLDGFAGAGLHDSIPIVENESVDINYSVEPLMTDDDFRLSLMRGIAKVGVEVEDAMGGMPQDIEGCFKDGMLYVVQARPQV